MGALSIFWLVKQRRIGPPQRCSAAAVDSCRQCGFYRRCSL